MTDVARRRRVEDLCDAALNLEARERTSYVAAACGGDEALRQEVEALLAHAHTAEGFLAAPMGAVAAHVLADELGTSLVGRQVGAYRVLALLGAGGMGEVYRARDTKLGRDVAIKILPWVFTSDPERLARFEREARMLAALNHLHIGAIYGLEHADGVRALVLELVEGETLAERVSRGALPMAEALRVAQQIADALEAAHDRGIVHRDLKPGNIKITPAGIVKVLDFGLAKVAAGDNSTPDLMQSPTVTAGGTKDGVILGTAAYMSPEQARGQVVDRRTDIWAFGCVLFEMLTGRAVFPGKTVSDTIAKILEREPDWNALPGSTPTAIRRLLRRCIEKDRKRRLADAADARLDIEESLIAPSASEAAAPVKPVSARRGRTWAVAATLVLTGYALWQLALAVATQPQTVRRLAVSIPANQAFVDIPGNAVLFTPDGTAIVYSGRGPRGSQLYYRRLDQLEATGLPATDNACCPAMSPSGDWVAFESANRISKVSVHGGAPIALADVAYSGGLSWGSDDSIFSAEGAAGLFRVPANGGPVQRIAAPDTALHESGWFMPMAMPDRTSVLLWTYKQPVGDKLAMVRIADGKVTELEGDGENPIGLVGGLLLFGRVDGTLGVAPFNPGRTRSVEAVIPVLDAPLHRNSGLQAAVSSAGDLVYVKGVNRSRITLLDAEGRITGSSNDERDFESLRISPDGQRIALTECTGDTRQCDVWLYEIASGVLQRLTTLGNAALPVWTADGRRVLFTVRPDTGPAEEWWVPADRSGPAERLIAMPFPNSLGGGFATRAVPSPDLRYVVIATIDSKTKGDLYLVDLNGDRKPEPLEHSAFNETSPAVSPDGQWLAYSSDESGRDEVYVRPFPGSGAHVQISADGGSNPRWEKDSRGIVYGNANRLVKARLSIGRNITVTKRDTLFSMFTGAKSNYDVFAGATSDYDLAPNGTIVALRSQSVDAELIVVTNWIADLKAKAGKK